MSSAVDALASMFPGRDRHTLQTALEAHGGSMERTVEYLLATGIPTSPTIGALRNSNNSTNSSPPSYTRQAATESNYASSNNNNNSNNLSHTPSPATANLDRTGALPTIVYDSGNPIADRALARQLEQDEIMARALALEEERAAQAQRDSPLAIARGLANTVVENAPTLPSLSAVSALVTPVINGIHYAGKVAVDAVSGIYEDIVHTASATVAGSSSDDTTASRRRGTDHARELSADDTQVIRGDAASPARPGLQARPRKTAAVAVDSMSGEKKRE